MLRTLNEGIAQTRCFVERMAETYPPSQYVEFAHMLLGGELALGYAGVEAKRYNPHRLDRFDWGQGIPRNTNTYSLHLFGLRHVWLLARAHGVQPDVHFLELADDFVLSLHAYLTGAPQRHGMADNNHAVAERLEALVALHDEARRAGYALRCQDELIWLVEDSLAKLLAGENYLINHNHGILADKAALIGAIFLNHPTVEEEMDRIVVRLRQQVAYAFTDDGVHKENSLGYHFLVLTLLWGCYYALEYAGHGYGQVMLPRLGKAYVFAANALKPDGYRPPFGDTTGVPVFPRAADGTRQRPAPVIPLYDSPLMRYVATRGQDGQPPEELSVLFPSGYVFFREHFRPHDYDQATWLSLKAGYTTRVHKHRDDLSICLYSKGYDIFVDSGMCGYMPRDRYKDYMESVPAHTTIGIRGEDYSIAAGNGERFRIQRFQRGADYDYAMASARIYEGVAIYRHVYYLRRLDAVVLRDEIHADRERTFVQYFNLSNDVSLGRADCDEVELAIGDGAHCAILRQVGGTDGLTVRQGEDGPSFVSTGFGSCDPARTLEFHKTGAEVEFLTVIEIHRREDAPLPVGLDDARRTLSLAGVDIALETTVPVRLGGASVSVVGSTVTVRNPGGQPGTRFALYALTQKGEYHKLPYTTEETLAYTNECDEGFRLIYFVANQTGEVCKGILGEFRRTPEGLEATKVYHTPHQPVVAGRQVEPLGANRTRFTVEVAYDYPAACSWWVYHNGSLRQYEQNQSYSYECCFDNPGEYVVMYSFRDKCFGEFAFDQFEKIVR